MGKLEDLMASLDSALGDNAGNQAITDWIDTGFDPLNAIISGSPHGGLPMGRMGEVFGESSTGKTALATKWMVAAQQAGGVAGFSDWERSFSVDLAKQFGLSDKRPEWLYFKPKTWEEGNVVAAKACKVIRESGALDPKAPIVWVFDSIAAALPKSQAEKEITEYTMNDTTALARVTSTTLKAMAQHAEEYNALFVYLNQMRLKPGVSFGDPRTTPGGKAMEFYASFRLILGRQKIMEGTGDDKEFIGQKISIQCVKSKFTRPFQDTSLRLIYDENDIALFDTITSAIEFLIENEAIVYKKPRVTWVDGKQYFIKALAEKIRRDGEEPLLRKMIQDFYAKS
jgi:protein RecA